MAEPTAQEQLMLELVNRARLDPLAEAARQGIGLNDGIAAGAINGSAKQVLAFNLNLVDAAHAHSAAMNNSNFFAHNNPVTGSTPEQRMAGAGYVFGGSAWGNGENISWRSPAVNTPQGLADAITLNHGQLYASTHGHREMMFNAGMREIGIGQAFGTPDAGNDSGSIVTQDYAFTGGRESFLTGVVYNDLDGDRFYDVGEGRGGINVSVVNGPAGMATWGAGGYSIANVTGTHTVTFSGGDLAAPVSAIVRMPGTTNVKLDLVNNDTIMSSASATLSTNAVKLFLLGEAVTGAGNTLNNTIVGDRAGNFLYGMGGNDTLSGLAGNDKLIGGSGNDAMFGGLGNDTFDFNSTAESGIGVGLRDRILDFQQGVDKIDLATIDAITATAGINDTFAFVGTANFTAAGQVHFFQVDNVGTANDRTVFSVNTGGTTAPEFQVELRGLYDLHATDFVL